MKNKILIALSLVLAVVSMAIFPNESSSTLPDLNGTWLLEIDRQIDGAYRGNHGCSLMEISMDGPSAFSARYTECGAASQNAMPSQFTGQIYQSPRGILITMLQYGRNVNYYCNWAGTINRSGQLVGLATDLEGNQAEFRLTQQ